MKRFIEISAVVLIAVLVFLTLWITKAERDATVNRLSYELERFRDVPGYDSMTVDSILHEFEDAVNSNSATWKELGTDQSELKDLARQNMMREKRN